MTGTWFAGWATGDIVTAAEFRKGAGSIFDTTLAASAAQIDVTSIPQTYAHLLITLYARGDVASTITSCLMRFNGDSGATYDWEDVSASGASAVAVEGLAQPGLIACAIPGASAAANLFGSGQVFIPHYAGSVNQKMFISIGSAKTGIATGNIRIDLFGGGWRATSAINRITLLPQSGNFVAGTRVTIHALGA